MSNEKPVVEETIVESSNGDLRKKLVAAAIAFGAAAIAAGSAAFVQSRQSRITRRMVITEMVTEEKPLVVGDPEPTTKASTNKPSAPKGKKAGE